MMIKREDSLEGSADEIALQKRIRYGQDPVFRAMVDASNMAFYEGLLAVLPGVERNIADALTSGDVGYIEDHARRFLEVTQKSLDHRHIDPDTPQRDEVKNKFSRLVVGYLALQPQA